MISFQEKIDCPQFKDRPWLVIGKGPSFSRIADINPDDYCILALNHTIEKLGHTDFIHAIDLDVITRCADDVYQKARYLVMPYYPHVGNVPGDKNLGQLAEEIDILGRLDQEQRLLCYNASTAGDRPAWPNAPVIPVRYFSADAAIALLAYSGIRDIRSAGVDGGTQYNVSFSHLNDVTLLANGQPSFDMQFRAITETLLKTGATLIPLGQDGPVQIYVGSQHEQMLAVKVLEYSIRRHASISVSVFPMHKSTIAIPMPKDKSNQPRTPFSFQRFLAPALNGYQGHAIYMDSGMQVFTDIRDIWFRDMSDTEILSVWEAQGSLRQPQFSVMLMDCGKLSWNIVDIVKQLDTGTLTYEKLMYEMAIVRSVAPVIEPGWNSLERFEEGKTKLLHYTDMNSQPWLSRDNPLAPIWIQELYAAIQNGFIPAEFLKEEILAGNVRPSLWLQYKRSSLSAKKSTKARLLDLCFIPPHARFFYHKKNNIFGRLYSALIGLIIKFW